MIRLILFLIIVYSSFISIKIKQEPCYIECKDTIILKGYAIIQMSKFDVEFWNRNEKRKQAGESYQTTLDLPRIAYFIPLDSINSNRYLSDIINMSNFYKNTGFYLPSKRTQLCIQKFCGKYLELVSYPTNLMKHDFYIVHKGEEKYLYRIEYIESKSLYTKVENINSYKYFFEYNFNRSYQLIDCYFMYDITYKSSEIPPDKNIKLWKYIEN